MATPMPLIEEYCEHFGMAAEEVLAVPFTTIVPISHRPSEKSAFIERSLDSAENPD